jgi:Tfp pilus assembly protein PilV
MKFNFSQGSKTKPQQGFSLLEATIASMISLVFMSLGANLVLAANIHKIVAKRSVTMNNFIQSDLDAIKYQANLVAQNNTKCNAGDKNGDGSIISPELPVWQGYGGALKDKLLATAATTNNVVASTTTVKIINQDYTMTRTLEAIPGTDPNIMPISYKFTRDTTPNIIEHQLYVELMPNIALTCPAS